MSAPRYWGRECAGKRPCSARVLEVETCISGPRRAEHSSAPDVSVLR